MDRLRCKYERGCIVQRLLVANEEISFCVESNTRDAQLNKPDGIVNMEFRKSEMVDEAQVLAKQDPCVNCPEAIRELFNAAKRNLQMASEK